MTLSKICRIFTKINHLKYHDHEESFFISYRSFFDYRYNLCRWGEKEKMCKRKILLPRDYKILLQGQIKDGRNVIVLLKKWAFPEQERFFYACRFKRYPPVPSGGKQYRWVSDEFQLLYGLQRSNPSRHLWRLEYRLPGYRRS